MFGNTVGWRISILVFVLNVGAALWLHGQMELTEPTSLSLDQKNLAELSIPQPSEKIVAHDQGGNAGEKYEAAIAAYNQDEDACDAYGDKPEGALPAPMQLIVDATNMLTMDLFIKNPAAIVDYNSDHAGLDTLAKIGQDMESAALRLQRQGKPDDAKKLLLAVYSLGEGLLRERLTYDEYTRGMGLMNGAATALADMEPPGSHGAEELNNQASAMVGFDQTNVRPVYEILSAADPQRVAANAGDVVRFARMANERMFRIEAILKLGRYRYNSGRAADQLAAPRLLKSLEADPDPSIQTAARAAQALTIEQYRMIH
jgi:hypothetical protein